MARIFRSFPVFRPLSRPIVSPAFQGRKSYIVQTRIRPRPTMAVFQQLPVVPAVAQKPIGKAIVHMVERRHVAAYHPYHLFSQRPPAVVVSTRRRFSQIY